MSEETTTNNGEQESQSSQAAAAEEKKKSRSRTRSRKKETTSRAKATEAKRGKGSAKEGSVEEQDSMDRAEKIVAEWTVRAEHVGTDIGHRFVRLFARAREEAEDIWAEAQAIRQTNSAQQDESQQ